jgi:transcriptional regulator with XRE-family HTH domain
MERHKEKAILIIDLEKLPLKLRNTRHARCMSIKDAASQAGVSRGTWQSIELGRDVLYSTALKVIAWLGEDMEVDAQVAVLKPPTYGWQQPACLSCFTKYRHGDEPVVVVGRDPKTEKCVYCNKDTNDGIYIKISPRRANYPTLLKEG